MLIIKKELQTQEPMHCHKDGCTEELNGLMNYDLDLGDGFHLKIWLCYEHSQQFDRKISKINNLELQKGR